MKFKAPQGDIHLALRSGHTTVITPEGVELPDMFHREAIARGCIPVGVSGGAGVPVQGASKEFVRADVITEAMKEMLVAQAEGDFTASGAPNIDRLSAKCGFRVEREERDSLWEQLEAEAAKD